MDSQHCIRLVFRQGKGKYRSKSRYWNEVNSVVWNPQRYWGTSAGLWGRSTQWQTNLHLILYWVRRPARFWSRPRKTILIIILKKCLGICVPPLPKVTISSRPSPHSCSTPAISCPDLQSNPNLRQHLDLCSSDLEASCSGMRRFMRCCPWLTVLFNLRRMMRESWVRRTRTLRRYFSCTMIRGTMLA